MSLYELIQIIAYAAFLVGAAISFYGNNVELSLWVMGLGVVLDCGATMLGWLKTRRFTWKLKPPRWHMWLFALLSIILWGAFTAAVLLRFLAHTLTHTLAILGLEVFWLMRLVFYFYQRLPGNPKPDPTPQPEAEN